MISVDFQSKTPLNRDTIPLKYPPQSSQSSDVSSYVLFCNGAGFVSQSGLFCRAKLVRSSRQVSSGVWLCLMRIAFVVISIVLIILVVLTGVYYTADLSLQAGCRMVHDDQPLLVSFILGEWHLVQNRCLRPR